MPAADGGIWLAGFIATFFIIKILAARALKRILPDAVKTEKPRGLPPAGDMGLWALPVTGIAWLAAAFFATPHPAWIDAVLRLLHHG
jgi:hypothetical protein